ncbi:MAG: hypothetical protein J5I65_13260 [Aridibacter famidurans]|nr:hypothetical protein [Aridibacter famidurans]
MKKKVRKIDVGGQAFNWNVVRMNENYVCLRVWSSEDRSKPWIQVRLQCEDFLLKFSENAHQDQQQPETLKLSVTPADVASIIRLAFQSGLDPERFEAVGNYLLTKAGRLEPINDVLNSREDS